VDTEETEKTEPQPDAAKEGNPEAADKTAKPATTPVDYQLARALDLLRGLALYRNRMVN